MGKLRCRDPTGVYSRRAAIGSASIDPADVAAVSVHGTGTPLGDPIEVGALGQGLGSGGGSRKQQQQGNCSGPGGRPLMLLSNKACYGHTEGTAGISGTKSGCPMRRDLSTKSFVHYPVLSGQPEENVHLLTSSGILLCQPSPGSD